MKTLNALKSVMVLVCAVFMFVLVSCEKENTAPASEVLYSLDDDIIVPIPNKVGPWSAGDGGMPNPYHCACPQGICSAYTVIQFDSGTPHAVSFVNDNIIRFARQKEVSYNFDDFSAAAIDMFGQDVIDDYGGTDALITAFEFMTKHFQIEGKLLLSEGVSKRLLMGKGNSITVLPNNYPILENKDYPFGYFDVKVVVE